MAIMGIPQALKMIEGPIDALARLPQQELVAMAQRSPSVLKVLPIVLNEKAEAAQRAANMAALAQGTPPSVTEQNMAINAQAEAQPMMQMQQPPMMAAPQQMAPMDAGVASLPVPEGTYATGGIVAFEEGGQAKSGNATDAIEQLYTRELARASDPEGYRFWSEKFGPEVSADERALFIAEAAPEVQRRIAAGDTKLPSYMKVDPVARRALQSKDITTDEYKALANYFGNQWIGGEAEDPASLTRRDYIERPRTGYDLATFLSTRSQQHGAQADTAKRMEDLLAPYIGKTGTTRAVSDEGAGLYVTNPMTGETEIAQSLGVDNIYRVYRPPHQGTIGDPEKGSRYAVGMDYRIDPETGEAYYIGPYTGYYKDRGHRDWQGPLGILSLAGGALFGGPEGLLRSLFTSAATGKAKGGEIPRYQNRGLVDLVRDQQGSDPYSQYYGSGPTAGLSDYVRQYQSLTAPFRELSEEEKAAMAIRGRSPEEIRQQKYMRILEAGLGILGGTSPYALTNIGQGSQAALKGYAEDIRERRKEDLALTQAKADMARRRREEQLADITGGMGLMREAKAEERATAERVSREDIAKLDRQSREKIVNTPPDVIRGAMAIKKPDETLDDAIARFTEITKKADRYNAISNRLAAANKAFYESAGYDTLSRSLKNAKTEAERKQIQTKLNDLRDRYRAEAEIGPGDLAFLRGINAKLGLS